VAIPIASLLSRFMADPFFSVVEELSGCLGEDDGKVLACWIGKEAAISGVAHQRLVALRQLAFETGQQGGTRFGVLAGLFRVAG
jgi:hypothetical protein